MRNAFELFEIYSNSERLKEFRKAYIESVKKPILYKIVSSRPDWFNYSNGVYDADKFKKKMFFKFDMTPIRSHRFDYVIYDFIENGQTTPNSVKAVRYKGKDIFLFSPPTSFSKSRRKFLTYPVLEISEDIYNLCLIECRNFDEVTVDDLSQYSMFFTVGEEPYKMVSERNIKELYRTGEFSRDEYKEMINSYKREVSLVKTLRR